MSGVLTAFEIEAQLTEKRAHLADWQAIHEGVTPQLAAAEARFAVAQSYANAALGAKLDAAAQVRGAYFGYSGGVTTIREIRHQSIPPPREAEEAATAGG